MHHPDPIDHLPLISMLTNRDIEYVNALQESRIVFNQNLRSNGQVSKHYFQDWGTGFQLSHGNAEGYFSTNEYDGVGTELLNLEDQIKKRAKNSIISNNQSPSSINRVEIDLTSSGYWGINYENEADRLVHDIKDHLLDLPKFVDYSIYLEGQFIRKNFQSSDFLEISQAYSIAILTIEVKFNSSQTSRKRIETIGGISKADFNWNSIENRIDQLKHLAKEFINAPRPKPGKYKVILSPDTAYSLIHETIGHGCEADQIITANSFLTDMIGQKVASSELTVVDDSHIRTTGWAEFDDEGTKSQGTILIDEGFLVNYLHSKKTAKVMGTMSTGNARATTYLSPPEPRQSNIYVEPKDYSMDELAEEVNKGLLVGSTSSASTSIFSGEYSIECQYAHIIEDGEIKQMLGPLTLTGYSLESLSKVVAIGKNAHTITSECLKDDSRILIGAITPPILVEDIRVS